ncbi:MAG: SMI1/KNR4 family protein [Lachnospiraceae bacterium]|nr:SMI1/KNR4 family protein [Lachnospiraceae bacterium]
MLDFDFIKKVYDIKEFHGSTPEEIAKLKQKFGEIPDVLEEFYLKAGNTKKLQYGQDTWIMPHDYFKYAWTRDFDDGIILLNENQGVCQAYIRKQDLSLPDPPVYLWCGRGEELNLCASSVSEFLMAASAYEAAFTFDYNPEDFYYLSYNDIEEFESRLDKLPFKMQWISDDLEIVFYRNDPGNLIAALCCDSEEDGGMQLIYGAVNEEAYKKLEKAIDDICEPL